MQQPPQMFPSMPLQPTNITTDQIQKLLDENKKLIIAILENQNLGKLTECAQYQAHLQKNLMCLAAIADNQPQAPTMSPQMAPHPSMQQGAYYMQHPQAAMAMAQQPGMFSPKMPLQFSSPHQMQMLQQQQQMHQQYQQAFQGQMAMQAGGASNGMQSMNAETATVGVNNAGGAQPSAVPNDARGGNKQDASEPGTGVSGSRGRLAGGNGGNNGTEEAK